MASLYHGTRQFVIVVASAKPPLPQKLGLQKIETSGCFDFTCSAISPAAFAWPRPISSGMSKTTRSGLIPIFSALASARSALSSKCFLCASVNSLTWPQ